MQTTTTNTSHVNTTNLFNLRVCTHHRNDMRNREVSISLFNLSSSVCIHIWYVCVCSFWYVLLSIIRLFSMKMTRIAYSNWISRLEALIHATYRFWSKIISKHEHFWLAIRAIRNWLENTNQWEMSYFSRIRPMSHNLTFIQKREKYHLKTCQRVMS